MKVKNLLSNPDKWTQGEFARTHNGFGVSYSHPDAVRWCLLGAIDVCYPPNERGNIYKRLRDNVETSLVGFNDNKNTTFEDVKNLVTELDI